LLVQEKPARLRTTEIFYSLQGEGRFAGLPTVFVRLTGCPLRCTYCDTAYAFTGGVAQSIADITDKVASFKPAAVCVTGGEPLAQRECLDLLTTLCDLGHNVSLETSGALAIDKCDPRVCVVLDVKTPASNESARNLYANFACLGQKDMLKFVICDRNDYEWSKNFVTEHNLQSKAEVWFSPSYHQLQPDVLAAWILEDHLTVRMQCQLHKIIWGDKPGC
jgi:7-carboxy-7-deazaguanine synthase